MNAFRMLLGVLLAGLVIYTAVVVADHGFGPLFPTFFGDLLAMGWPGQFNADFSCMLTLSGLWLAWRHHFSAAGLVLGLLGLFGGALLLTFYLLVASFAANGDGKVLLLGPRRATS